MEWLGNVFVALTLVGCAVMLGVVWAFFYQLRCYLALRPVGVAQEQRTLAHPLPPDEALPHVVVQIPTFNEGAIVARCIARTVTLDWPKDKLHIQVCDDSTDTTTGIAESAAERARAEGFDVAVIHRTERSDFKAGALQNAMAQTPHGYFVILDVDSMPSADFLRRCMAALLPDPSLGFVQARQDYLNADENFLTRAQVMMLDLHFAVEQAPRSWAQQVVLFNGTGGIWRRAAIEAAGGWRGHTLSEDWDLSYRAWFKGWRGVFLNSVTVAGELPTRLGVWATQQARWASGIGEVALSMLPALVRNRALSPSDRMASLVPLATWIGHVMYIATLFLVVAAVLLKPSVALPLGLGVYLVYLAGWATLLTVMLVASRAVGRNTPLWRFLLDYQVVAYLTLYLCWQKFCSVPATLFGRRRIFVRTPKQGSVARQP